MITSLFPYDPQLCFEHFSIQMAPGAISESTPHENGVFEHFVVIDGQLDLCVDGEWQSLNCGEGVRFAAEDVYKRQLQCNAYTDNNPKGFGLLQLDRDFSHYQDIMGWYNKRPSLWVEPRNKWGCLLSTSRCV